MEGGLLLDVIIGQSSSIFELFSCEDQPLLIRRDAFLILDLSLDVLNGVRRLNLEGDRLTGQRLHENLHTSSQPENKMEGGLLLDVVVRESPAIFELFSCEDQPLLVWGDALLILDLGLDVLDGVRWLNLQSDGLSSQRFHEDLHTSSQPQDKVKSGLLLDVVVGERPSILQLFTSKNQSLLVWRDALLVLDLGLHVLDSVRRLDLKCDGLAGQGLHKDLHTSSQPQDKVEGGLLLDVVVRKCPSILQLFTSEDQSLLVWRNAFLVLNLGLHVPNGVRRLDLEGDSLSSQCLHKDLHTSSQPQDKMEGGLLLDVVRWFNFEGDCFTGQCLHENLHSSTKSKN